MTNQNQYLEINFTISSDNGVFDNDISRFDLLPDFGDFYSVRNPVEKYFLFDGDTLLSESSYPGFVANDFNAGSVDFSSIRDGSIQGVIHFYAWDADDPDKAFEFGNFGWSLDVCNINGCSFAPNSYITFGEIRAVSTAVSEPSMFILLLLSLMILVCTKCKSLFK